jgi:DNA-binding transcriptional MerR regulator
MEQEFLISQAARMLGITGETLRNYEKRGVLTFRRCSGFRIVTLADLERVRQHRKAFPQSRGRPTVGAREAQKAAEHVAAQS